MYVTNDTDEIKRIRKYLRSPSPTMPELSQLTGISRDRLWDIGYSLLCKPTSEEIARIQLIMESSEVDKQSDSASVAKPDKSDDSQSEYINKLLLTYQKLRTKQDKRKATQSLTRAIYIVHSDITVSAVAEASGFTKSQISTWLRGLHAMTDDSFTSYVAYLLDEGVPKKNIILRVARPLSSARKQSTEVSKDQSACKLNDTTELRKPECASRQNADSTELSRIKAMLDSLSESHVEAMQTTIAALISKDSEATKMLEKYFWEDFTQKSAN